MQIVISVTDLQRKWIENYGFIPDDLNVKMAEVILNGTVLPEHGRLIDADVLVKKYGTKVDFINGRVNGEYINAPTILEATGEQE